MKLTAEREKLLAPLQAVIGVVERRQTMPVLTNVLLGVRQGQLSITATDLEVFYEANIRYSGFWLYSRTREKNGSAFVSTRSASLSVCVPANTSNSCGIPL